MLRIPCLRQPSRVACLPTCVRAVLAYLGRRVSDDEAAAICQTESMGTVADKAIEGLAEAGIDSAFVQLADVDDLGRMVDDDQPVIVFIRHPAGAAHAVVVCSVTADTVTFMDPAMGAYTELGVEQFEGLWHNLRNGAIMVGSAQTR